MLVVMHYASALRRRYKRINNLLIKANDLHNIINSLIPKYAPNKAINNVKTIREVTDYYLLLSELVEIFNKIFGWQIFFATENVILTLLDMLNNLMINLDDSQNSTHVNHDFKTILFLVSFCIILIVSITYC